jgi:hypothetical protein
MTRTRHRWRRRAVGGLALPALERLVAIVDEQAKGPTHSRMAGTPGTRTKNER